MLKKPMTTEEYFNKICEIMEEKGMMPGILDYALAAHEPAPMKTYEYDIRNNLDYGGNEGIYLDLWIEYYDDDRSKLLVKWVLLKMIGQEAGGRVVLVKWIWYNFMGKRGKAVWRNGFILRRRSGRSTGRLLMRLRSWKMWTSWWLTWAGTAS